MEKWAKIKQINDKTELGNYLASLASDIRRPTRIKMYHNKPLFLSVIDLEHSRRLVFSCQPGALEAIRDRFIFWDAN